MTLSILLSLIGLAITLGGVLLTMGIAWGTLSSGQKHEKETRAEAVGRLEDAVKACRTDWQSNAAQGAGFGSERLSLVSSDVEGLGEKIDRGFAEVKGAINSLSTKLVEHDYRIKSVEEKLGSIREMTRVRADARREPP